MQSTAADVKQHCATLQAATVKEVTVVVEEVRDQIVSDMR